MGSDIVGSAGSMEEGERTRGVDVAVRGDI